MKERFTWIPFFMELEKALLEYKDDRKPLVDFIYSELTKVGEKSLVDYIHMKDGSKVKDIDPFSLFAIFNRNLKPENKNGFLQKFKERFGLKSDIPTDFDGIPTVNSQRAFFFNWAEKNKESIEQFWELFEGVVLEKDISQIFDKMVNKIVSQYSLTMILYWIAPDRFLNLDGRNRSYLKTFGFQDDYPDLNYADYIKLIETVRRMMSEQKIPATSFPELSHAARNMAQTSRIWMYRKYDDAFSFDVIKMGSSAKGQLDFSTFKSKKALGDAYRQIRKNTDVSLPDMYWKLIMDVKIGDIVVVFDSVKDNRRINHDLYGWGRITSDVFFDKDNENPIQRKVEWHRPLPDSPIRETMTNNSRYFHEVIGIEAANIMNLLGINSTSMSSNKNFWLAGYYIDDKSNLEEFFANNEWIAWFGEKDVNQLKQAKSIQKGDVLILKSTLTKGPKHNIPCMRIMAVAIVDSDIESLDNRPPYEGVRFKVQFISKESKDFDGGSFGSYRRTIQKCDNPLIIDYVNSLFLEDMEEQNKYQKYINLLEANKNLVLTGAPGTGKTFMAKAIAKVMGAEREFVQFHPSYDYTDFVEGLRPIQGVVGDVGFERKDGAFKEFCKRAAKNLEDSKKSRQELTEEKSLEDKYNEVVSKIENGEINEFQLKTSGKVMEVVKISDFNNIILKTPDTSSDRTYTVSFARIAKLAKAYPDAKSLDAISNLNESIRDVIGGCNASSYWAVLKEVYKQGNTSIKANFVEVQEKPFVFIIDEINRGEISKIFGELFFSIDPGYRGVAGRVKTQYQNLIEEGDAFEDGFYVPENVYIIGTMNDIDRSVESMDFAMRRRFAWAEVTAEESMQMLSGIANENEIKRRMLSLNKAILKIRGLGEAYQIGAAYFKKIEEYDGDFQKLWDFHLKGLLFEYLRGNTNAEEQLNKLKEAYDNKED